MLGNNGGNECRDMLMLLIESGAFYCCMWVSGLVASQLPGVDRGNRAVDHTCNRICSEQQWPICSVAIDTSTDCKSHNAIFFRPGSF